MTYPYMKYFDKNLNVAENVQSGATRFKLPRIKKLSNGVGIHGLKG